jgi:hypothetical protein
MRFCTASCAFTNGLSVRTDSASNSRLVPAGLAEERDRRLEEHRRNPLTGIHWEQVKAELDQKYGSSK